MELDPIIKAIVDGDQNSVSELTRMALQQNVDPGVIVGTAFIPAMDRVGSLFSSGEIYVPEMLRSARAMKTGMEVIKPLYRPQSESARIKVLICTVKGDLHDIGKNLVGMMLEGSGVDVIDLGVDVPPDAILRKVEELAPDFLAMSALLTTTMMSMEQTADAMVKAGVRDKVKVLVGGAPISQEFADSIGADGYGKDAGEAVKLVRRLWKGAAA